MMIEGRHALTCMERSPGAPNTSPDISFQEYTAISFSLPHGRWHPFTSSLSFVPSLVVTHRPLPVEESPVTSVLVRFGLLVCFVCLSLFL